MSNKNYIKGVIKERQIVNAARASGQIAFRSAGSHSPIDCVIIDKEKKRIELVQCKPEKFSRRKRDNLEKKYDWLNDDFSVYFSVR